MSIRNSELIDSGLGLFRPSACDSSTLLFKSSGRAHFAMPLDKKTDEDLIQFLFFV